MKTIKMKTNLTIIALALLLSFNTNAQITTSLGATKDKTNLKIGFNRRSDKGVWWTNPSFKNLVAEMNPDVARFPGGTQANYWDWRTGEFIPGSGKNMGQKEKLSVTNFVKALPARTKVVYVVNLARPTPDTGILLNSNPAPTEKTLKSTATLDLKITDMIAGIDALKAAGREPFAIEIGNEFYFGNEEAGIFHIVQGADNIAYAGWDPSLNGGNGGPVVHDGGSSAANKKAATITIAKFYLDQCKTVVTKIKAKYPNMQFALITTKRGNGNSTRESWNTTIYNELANNADYASLAADIDGLTQHHYLNDKYGIQDPISSSNVKEIIAEGIQYPIDKNEDYTQSTYPIWFTEYGEVKKICEETWAAGVRAAAYTLGWINQGDNIGMFNWQYITDNNTVNTTDGTTGAGGDDVVNTSTQLQLAPVGIAFKQMSLATADMNDMQKITFANNPFSANANGTAVNALHGYKFKNINKETLFIVNIGDTDLTVPVANLISNTGIQSLTQYWSNDPTIAAVYENHNNIKKVTSTITGSFTAKKYSITVIEILDATASVGDNTLIDAAMYPNPVKNILHVSANETIKNIAVFDMAGKQILAVKNPSQQVDVSNLKPSLYIIRIETAKGFSTKKLIKL